MTKLRHISESDSSRVLNIGLRSISASSRADVSYGNGGVPFMASFPANARFQRKKAQFPLASALLMSAMLWLIATSTNYYNCDELMTGKIF